MERSNRGADSPSGDSDQRQERRIQLRQVMIRVRELS